MTSRSPAAAEAAFRARLAEAGAELLEPRWLGSETPHRVRCGKGHDCSPRPANVQRGQGVCRVCGRRDPGRAWSEFRARVADLGGVVLEPCWLGALVPHRVRCGNGHESSPRPANLQRPHSGLCLACAYESGVRTRRRTRTAEEMFRARLADLGAELLEPRWLGSETRHRVRCSRGHECSPLPANIRRGQGICRYCKGMGWDTFYVVTTDPLVRLKFGITSNDGRARLRTHRAAGYRAVVRLMTGLPGDAAPDLERAVLAALRLAGVAPVRGREYYDADAIALVLDVVDNYPIAAHDTYV